MTTPDFLDRASTSLPPALVVIDTTSALAKMLAVVDGASILCLELIGQHQVVYEMDGHQHRNDDHNNRGWGRRGPLSIVVLRAFPRPDIFVVDVDALGGGRAALTGRSFASRSLRTALESPRVLKVVWGIYEPVDMLWTQCGIRLQNGLDLQLVENATRPPGGRHYLCASLETALDTCLGLSLAELAYVVRCRRNVEERMVELAEEEEQQQQRPPPLSQDSLLLQHCGNCVRYLLRLYFLFMDRGDGAWLTKARRESAARIEVALRRGCDLRSPARALGPWGDDEEAKPKLFR